MQESTIAYFIAIVIIVFLLLTLSIILFFNFSRKRILAEKEKNHQQKMNFQKEMLAKTIETQEEERSRIARELHDDLSSKLNVVNMNVELLKLKNVNSADADILELIGTTIGESIERSRKISHELMPPILEKFGLGDAIQDLVRKINFSGRISMEVDGKEHLENIKGQNKLHIFRIVQELCNNTLKHADADRITLECNSGDNAKFIIYQDNGKGISKEAKQNGIGMMNIESRIQILGATWEQLPSDRGVCFKIIIPDEAQTNTS